MLQYVQVRPVTYTPEGDSLIRAVKGDPIFAWGVYVTDPDGLPMWELDYDTRAEAVDAAKERAIKLGVSVGIDELDGTTTWGAPDAV